MNTKVTAKYDFVDHNNKIRIQKDKQYSVVEEFDKTYLILDETGRRTILNKSNFNIQN